MNYIHFEFNTKKLGLKESKIRLYPLPCFHVGSPECDVKFIKEHIARIKTDPYGRWAYMGDGGEVVTRTSKGNLFTQVFNPQLQIEMLDDLFEPIKDKGLFGIRGNHGDRIFRDTGLSFDHSLCTRLGIPFLGAATFCNIVVNRSSYDLYFHHGKSSGAALGGKVTAADHFSKFIDCDAIFTAHSHVAVDLPPAVLQSCDNGQRKPRTKLRHQYICGTGYDSRGGYAEDRAYPPLLPSLLCVEFDGRIVEGIPRVGQRCEKFYSNGQYPITHDYVEHYLNKFQTF